MVYSLRGVEEPSPWLKQQKEAVEMAQNFLTISPAYHAGTPADLRALDEDVVRVLGPTYKVPKGSAPRLLAELQKKWPDLTKVLFGARVRLYRTAYALLAGHATDTHCTDAEKRHASAAGYLALKQDGIETWQQVEQLLTEELLAEAKEPQAAANPLTGMGATHVIVRRDELEAFVAESIAARARLDEAVSRIEALERSLAALTPTAVEEVRVSDLVATSKAATEAQPSKKAPAPLELPKTSRYRGVGREVRYAKAFMERLNALQEHERKRVLERIKWITEGSNARGLRVKPLTPPSLAAKYGGKPQCARASGDLRIVFKPNGQLEFVDILRKGSIAGTSEA